MIAVTDKQKRKLTIHKCEECDNKFLAPKYWKRRFCSRACADKNHRKRKNVRCAFCEKEFEILQCRIKRRKNKFLFCSRNCKDKAQRLAGLDGFSPSHYGTGKDYRNRVLRELGAQCSNCGYSVNIKMLDAHHKNGNREDNSLENFEVLCVWCHALKTRKAKAHDWNGDLTQ